MTDRVWFINTEGEWFGLLTTEGEFGTMKERDIQREFGKRNTIPGIFELKLCKGKSIRWDSVRPHQIDSLLKASSEEGLYHKITDPPIYAGAKTRFNAKRPFDCFLLVNVPAYVVVCFWEARKRKTCYYIRISDYVARRNEADRKSFREDEAKSMSCHTIDLMSKD